MNQNPVPETDDASEQIKVRQEKCMYLLAGGRQAYPVVLAIISTIAEIREKYSHLETGDETQDEVGITSRIMLAHDGDKLCFATLMDGEGNCIQTVLSAAEVGLESLVQHKADIDLGDHLSIHGRVISSRRGESSVLAYLGTAPAGLSTPGIGEGGPVPVWQTAAESIHPLPKTHTAENGTRVSLSENMRVRRCYLDMIVRPAARDMVRMRPKVVKSLRDYFDEAGFIEAEVPMLQSLHDSAAARPFSTHINTYGTDLFLRIAPELFLKRATVGGIDKILEINRNPRNEGADFSYSPEFTTLKAYETYGSYDTMAHRTHEFAQRATRDALDTELVTPPDGSFYDLSGSWAEILVFEATAEALGREFNVDTPLGKLVEIAEELGEDVVDHWGPDKITEAIPKVAVGDKLWMLTLVRDYPESSSPLTRGHRPKKGIVEKWDLYVHGFELTIVYSELVGPVIQRQRFEAQTLAAANGDPKAVVFNRDFLVAMKYGMPSIGDMGMGLDRLLMTLTGHGTCGTITFLLAKKLRVLIHEGGVDIP